MAKRAPLIISKSDDFVLEHDDKKYYPHKGEKVVFRRRISPRNLMALLKVQGFGEDSEDTQAMAEFMYSDVCEILPSVIQSWTWTDPYSENAKEPTKYPKPSAEALRDISLDELQYLIGKWVEVTGGASEGEEKNPPQPSSEPSSQDEG